MLKVLKATILFLTQLVLMLTVLILAVVPYVLAYIPKVITLGLMALSEYMVKKIATKHYAGSRLALFQADQHTKGLKVLVSITAITSLTAKKLVNLSTWLIGLGTWIASWSN